MNYKVTLSDIKKHAFTIGHLQIENLVGEDLSRAISFPSYEFTYRWCPFLWDW